MRAHTAPLACLLAAGTALAGCGGTGREALEDTLKDKINHELRLQELQANSRYVDELQAHNANPLNTPIPTPPSLPDVDAVHCPAHVTLKRGAQFDCRTVDRHGKPTGTVHVAFLGKTRFRWEFQPSSAG